MLVKSRCPMCQGSGVQMIQTSSLLGLIKKEVPTTCEHCSGVGTIFELPICKICEGQGLVGNENEICRPCNGTGKAETFACIPRRLLVPGTVFQRRCDQCGVDQMQIVSGIEQHTLTLSWESEEELRQKEVIERVKVRCTACVHSYYIRLNEEWNQELDTEEIGLLEDLKVDLSFLFGKQV